MQKTERKTTWSVPPASLGLGPAQVDVWRISLDLPAATVKSLESTLSADERGRAARFRIPGGRERYIAAHACLRDILVRYLDCEPGQLMFSTNDYGKPSLRGHKLEFNLSHSGDFALVAVTRQRKVGVDLERIRSEMEVESIARRFFSQSELREWLAVPPDQRQIAFFHCWTRKEAFIKAHGSGLSYPLKNFDVSLTPGETALLRATRPDPEESARWTLLSLEVAPSYAAAVAVGQGLQANNLQVRLWDWN